MDDCSAEVEYNVGIDVEEQERFVPLAAGGPTSLDALFGPSEHAYCRASANPTERYAGTWCAKEAVVKALWPWVRLEPRRVLVERAGDRGPSVHVVGWDAAGARVHVRVSISHAGEIAVASAVAWGPHAPD